MISIGITGGIGSGKSTVCNIFASLGIPVNNADELAKKIIVEDAELKKSIINSFGEKSYLPDGTYNREYIAQIVFNDRVQLQTLNQLVHPKVIEHSKIWAEKHLKYPYIIKEAALMFESGSYLYNDYNIVVESPLALRIQRICKRDGIDEPMALKKIQSQLSDEERRQKASMIIINDENTSLIQQVYQIHQNLLAKNDPR